MRIKMRIKMIRKSLEKKTKRNEVCNGTASRLQVDSSHTEAQSPSLSSSNDWDVLVLMGSTTMTTKGLRCWDRRSYSLYWRSGVLSLVANRACMLRTMVGVVPGTRSKTARL